MNEGKVIEFKHIVFTKVDVRENIVRKENIENDAFYHYFDEDVEYTIEIPEGVNEIDENAFGGDYDIIEIYIPETVKTIPMKLF